MKNWLTAVAVDRLAADGCGGIGSAPHHSLYAAAIGRSTGAQLRCQAAKLEHGIARLAAGQGVYKDMSALHPRLRMARCEQHYVFCLPRENAPALVVAILHERMDLMAHLAARLDA